MFLELFAFFLSSFLPSFLSFFLSFLCLSFPFSFLWLLWIPSLLLLLLLLLLLILTIRLACFQLTNTPCFPRNLFSGRGALKCKGQSVTHHPCDQQGSVCFPSPAPRDWVGNTEVWCYAARCVAFACPNSGVPAVNPTRCRQLQVLHHLGVTGHTVSMLAAELSGREDGN